MVPCAPDVSDVDIPDVAASPMARTSSANLLEAQNDAQAEALSDGVVELSELGVPALDV